MLSIEIFTQTDKCSVFHLWNLLQYLSSPERKAHNVSIKRVLSIVRRCRRPLFQTRVSLRPVGQSSSDFNAALLGWEIDKNWNLPYAYDIENLRSICLFFIGSSSNLQITRTGIKSRPRSNLVQIKIFTSELHPLEDWKNCPCITKTCLFKYIENFISKNWKFSGKKLRYLSYFCTKHRLWVLVRTASPRRF